MKTYILLFVLLGIVICEEKVKHGVPIKEDHFKDEEHNADFDHQAILGSEDEADIFDHLSPEESKKRLGELVDKMDTNGDGTVSQDELIAWIKSSFTSLNRGEAQQTLNGDDKDGDGSINWQEYLQSHIGMNEEELETYKQEELEAESDDKKQMEFTLKYSKDKFNAADENGDGQLTVDEYTAFLFPYDYPRMTEVEANRVLKEFDKNEDGVIDRSEYVSQAIQNAEVDEDEEAENKIAEEENFSFNDLDKDGKLNKEEIIKWVAPNLDDSAIEEATHLFEETDTDKDMKLTKSEIVEQVDLWVGSDATNYGDMLIRDEL